MKDSDVLDKANPNLRDYRRVSQGTSLQFVTETANLANGTTLHLDHNGCKTFADGTEKPLYEARIIIKEKSTFPKSPTDIKWLEYGSKVLREAGLCEKSKKVTGSWCQKLDENKSKEAIKKDANNIFAWRSSLQKNSFGEEEVLVLLVISKMLPALSVSNVVVTEGDSAD